jgi:bifunctional non-homologous end joining protein LigD
MTPRAKSRSASAKTPARLVDRQLERYRAMRDFHISAEPHGGSDARPAKSGNSLPFVVQKHAARQLHYDFRLGWRGVLKSWAVAKGPSYFPGDKRLAVEVEDHPMEYGGFEGTIPKGQYGGGTVMVWDFGEWEPLGDVDQELEKGNLKFRLLGTKLKGKWALVRMKRSLDRSNKPNWLLIKEKDEFAQPENSPAVLDLVPDSALTHRTMEQIAANQDHIWDSRQGLREPAKERSTGTKPRTPEAASQQQKALDKLIRSAPLEDFPGFVTPQLAKEARSVPNTRDWVHELKLDGYRIQIHVRTGAGGNSSAPKARLFTRKGLGWTARMPGIAQATAALGVESAILDGEVVVLDPSGRSSFADLQAAFQNGRQSNLVYFAFDLLHLNGHNLRGLPLLKRKEILEKLLSHVDTDSPLRFCEHIHGKGDVVFAKACDLGAEGIVSKLISSPYTSGRGNAWLKMKAALKQEFVIGGFTPVAKTGQGIGALLLGYYKDGTLLYAGRCGTGYSRETERTLRIRLDALVQKAPSFAQLPREARKDAIWVKPEVVAQIAFAAWTNDNLIRMSSFQGLREDKPATDVVRESPETASPPSPRATSSIRASVVSAPAKSTGQLPIAITHPNKVLDEASGMTKQQLAEYYLAIAEHMLPHIADRPLSILRCPDGIGKQFFFQKHMTTGLPKGVRNVPIKNKKTGKVEEFLTLNSAEGLLGLAQLAVLEIHPWGSKNDAVDKPDRIIFDLDPDEAIAWSALAAAAQELRSRLNELKLESYLKTTGGKGLHVVVPIQPEHDWPIIKQFAHAVVLKMEKDDPRLYTTNMSKAVRPNHIYLDYLRNDRESTAIAPFSTRARPSVPVAVTLDWKELRSSDRPRFYVSDFSDWQKRLRRDPWQKMLTSRQRLTTDMLFSFGVKTGKPN